MLCCACLLSSSAEGIVAFSLNKMCLNQQFKTAAVYALHTFMHKIATQQSSDAVLEFAYEHIMIQNKSYYRYNIVYVAAIPLQVLIKKIVWRIYTTEWVTAHKIHLAITGHQACTTWPKR